jgi:hypothetical protein
VASSFALAKYRSLFEIRLNNRVSSETVSNAKLTAEGLERYPGQLTKDEKL